MELKEEIPVYTRPNQSILRRMELLLLPGAEKKYIEKIFNSYFKFGFVRNPWDRVVSLYNRNEGIKMREQMSFEEFAEWIQLSSDTCVHPTPHKSQLDWFKDHSGRVVADYIGKFETIEKDWEFICNRLHISQPLPHENRNDKNQRHYTEYYTNKTQRLIAEKFKEDIDYFGYSFGR